MSVIRRFRSLSKAEFVTNAIELQAKVAYTLTKLPKNEMFLFGQGIMSLAMEIVNGVSKANDVYVQTHEDYVLRRTYLKKARASLAALDIQMSSVFNIMYKNPNDSFGKKKNDESKEEKKEKIEKTIGNPEDIPFDPDYYAPFITSEEDDIGGSFIPDIEEEPEKKKRKKSPKERVIRLAENTASLVDKEKKLIDGVLKSDRETAKKHSILVVQSA